MSRQKASYVLQDGLSPLLSQWLATKPKKSKGNFTIMFDRTITHQNRKQMNILLRFWDEDENQVVTKYLCSFHFARAKAVDITEMLLKLEEEECLSVPWLRLCNISTDRPNSNKAIFRNLDENLKEKGFKGLLEFLNCPLHITHNAFRKLIINIGETAEQLAFDLQAWFKVSVDKLCQLFFKHIKGAVRLRNKSS